MDSHLLPDVLTLSVIGLLLILLIAAKVTKKRKELRATKTSASQTSSWDIDLDKALAKINEEMSTFHGRLEKVEQHCLESLSCHCL